MSKLKILTNTGIYTAALLLPMVSGFFLLPLYTRYLMPEEYAIVALVTSFTAIIGIFIALQLQSGIARYVLQFTAKNDNQKAREFLSTIIQVMIVFMVVCFIFLEFSGNFLVKLVYPNSGLTYSPYFRLSLISVVLVALYQAPSAIFKAMQMARHFFVLNLLVLLSQVAVTVYLIVILQVGILGVFLGTLFGALLGCLVSFWMIRSWFCRVFIWQFVPQALFYSIPLIPHSLGTFLFTGANQIILEKYVPLADIGIFSLGSRLASIALLLVGCFNMAYNPYFIQSAEVDEKKAVEVNRDIIGYWYVAVLAMILGFVLFADVLLNIMATPAYHAAKSIAAILVFSSLFRGLYMFAVSPLFFKKKTYLIPAITLVTGVISVLLNIWAIPRFGIIGAAWVTVFAYFLTFVISERLSYKVLKILYPWRAMLMVSCLAILALIGARGIPLIVPLSEIGGLLLSFVFLVVYVLLSLMITDRTGVEHAVRKALHLSISRFQPAVVEEQIMEDMETRNL